MRFRVFDNPSFLDRYTIIDTKPVVHALGSYLNYFRLNAYPSDPAGGIGIPGGMPSQEWHAHRKQKFKGLGKSIRVSDLPGDARKAADQFVREILDGERLA